MQLIKVSIPNWTKYNPRSDRSIHTWFRFQNNFFDDQRLFGCSDSQLLLFICMLSEASKVQGDTFDVNLEYIANKRRVKISRIISDFEELETRGVLSPAEGGWRPAKVRAGVPATNERTNVTNVTNDTVCESGDSLHPIGMIWNDTIRSRPKIRDWNPTRTRLAKSLLVRVTTEEWAEACRKVEDSDFLSGRNGKWTSCSFDWLLKATNLTKVLEGNYDNQAGPSSGFGGRIEDILAKGAS